MKIKAEETTAARKRRFPVRLVCMLAVAMCLVAAAGTAGTMAYLTHKPAAKTNNFSIGEVTITIKEDFDKPSSMPIGTTTYKKTVKFQNTGHNEAYARVNFAFSNTDVSNLSQISHDNGATWYSLADFKTHLPAGWAYKSTGALGGYYYYTAPLAPGATTTPLFTHVRTTFQAKTADTNQTINKTPRNYDIYVYAEGLQQMRLNGSSMHTSYETAWTEFLNLKR